MALTFPLTSSQAHKICADATFASAPQLCREELASWLDIYVPEGYTFDPESDLSVAIGAFDGVHLGHQQLIDACISQAKIEKSLPVALTFDPDPSFLVASQHDRGMLLSVEHRISALASLGVGAVCVVKFDQYIMDLSYQDFLRLLLGPLPNIVAIHVGTNFRMGAGGAGDVSHLKQLSLPFGLHVFAHELRQSQGTTISATTIRNLLAQGEIEGANELLGRSHCVWGNVVHGRGEGSSFGFPTANLACDSSVMLPREGVYATFAIADNLAWPAAVNVGAPPTFSEATSSFLEANLIGFSGDMYGKRLGIAFVAFLRESRPFSSIEELERVVKGNIAWVQESLGSKALEVAHDF